MGASLALNHVTALPKIYFFLDWRYKSETLWVFLQTFPQNSTWPLTVLHAVQFTHKVGTLLLVSGLHDCIDVSAVITTWITANFKLLSAANRHYWQSHCSYKGVLIDLSHTKISVSSLVWVCHWLSHLSPNTDVSVRHHRHLLYTETTSSVKQLSELFLDVDLNRLLHCVVSQWRLEDLKEEKMTWILHKIVWTVPLGFPNKRDMNAHQKIWIKPLKETNLRMA